VYVERLEWELGFSKNLFILTALTHTGAFCIVGWVVPYLVLKILCMLAILGNARKIMRTHLLRCTPHSVVKLWQETNGRFGCQFKLGQSAYGEVKGESFKSFACVVLRLKLSNRVLTLFISRDSVSTPLYRILCSRLNQL
jgi:hypothetical protein